MTHPAQMYRACWRRHRCALFLATIVLAAMFAATSLALAEDINVSVTSHGGPVETEPHVYEIYWGTNWTSEPAAAERVRLEAMYKDISGSVWQGILTQYWGLQDFISHSVFVAGSYLDEEPGAAPSGVNQGKTEEAVLKAIEHKITGWPSNLTETNVNDQFVVLTPPGTTFSSETEDSGCGIHYHRSEHFVYARVPWDHYVSKELKKCEMTVAASHEYAEGTTDPYENGWRNWAKLENNEIADLCEEEEWGQFEGGIKVAKLWDSREEREEKSIEVCSALDPTPPQILPEILTEGASVVSASNATLNGTVKPNGLDIRFYWFELGTKEPFEQSPHQSYLYLGQKSSEVNAKITELASGTTYKYRLVTEDEGPEPGLQEGAVKEFRTPGAPVVTTEPASYVNTFEPQLNASVNPNGADTHYHFEYDTKEYKTGEGGHGTSVPVPSKDIGSEANAQAVSFTLKSLERNKTYYYRVVAENEAGTTDGSGKSFTTLPPCKGAEEKCVWSTQSTPNPPPLTEDSLKGVSCTSSTSCLAVGYNKYAVDSFTEHLSGSEWTVAKTFSGEMKSVSCPATNVCFAIGATSSGSLHYWGLASGEQFASGTPPTPTGATSPVLRSISCTSESTCTAVGSYFSESKEYKPLVERYNGSSWSTQTALNPSEGNASEAMLSVSCASATSCTTVGKAAGKPTAEHWNGSTWSVITPLNPTGSEEAVLEGVSCAPGAAACMAVGHYHEKSGHDKALAENWSGTTWSTTTTPAPAESEGGTDLYGVSCLSSSSCFAAGRRISKEEEVAGIKFPAEEKTVSEAWSGGPEWTVQTTSNVEKSAYNTFASVSCASSIACTAAGLTVIKPLGAESLTLAEDWNSTKWATQTTPNPSPLTEDSLKGVSCTSSTSCLAVGYNKYAVDSFTEHLSGSEWTVAKTFSGEMKSVSCPATNVCFVTGVTGSSLHYWELASGEQFASGTPPTPTGATSPVLRSISCTSESTCTAVGSYFAESKEYEPLVERYNGSSWSIQSAPNPTEGSAGEAMLSVSCASATSCTTAGRAAGKPTAEHWNGSTWSVITPQNPTGGEEVVLEGVSCAPAATACMAVGHYHEKSGHDKSLAESWSGSAWSIVETPTPGESEGGNDLYGISCVSPNSCTSAGRRISKEEEVAGIKFPSEEKTVAETWSGSKWSVQSTPNVEKSAYSTFASVSCASSIVCTTAGATNTKSLGAESLTLAEHYE